MWQFKSQYYDYFRRCRRHHLHHNLHQQHCRQQIFCANRWCWCDGARSLKLNISLEKITKLPHKIWEHFCAIIGINNNTWNCAMSCTLCHIREGKCNCNFHNRLSIPLTRSLSPLHHHPIVVSWILTRAGWLCAERDDNSIRIDDHQPQRGLRLW